MNEMVSEMHVFIIHMNFNSNLNEKKKQAGKAQITTEKKNNDRMAERRAVLYLNRVLDFRTVCVEAIKENKEKKKIYRKEIEVKNGDVTGLKCFKHYTNNATEARTVKCTLQNGVSRHSVDFILINENISMQWDPTDVGNLCARLHVRKGNTFGKFK